MKPTSVFNLPVHRTTLLVLVLSFVAFGRVPGQEPGVRFHPDEVLVGSELERYLRVLQVAGHSEPYPLTIRELTPRESARLFPRRTDHPWAARFPDSVTVEGLPRVTLVSPWVRGVYNTAFPAGSSDGPVWTGRGATGAVGGGVAARWGPVDLTLAPVAFVSENRGFDLAPTGTVGEGAFRDPRRPNHVDLPQRFGDGSYGRLDPGASSLRLYVPGVVAGFSAAAQSWGPGIHYPLILGSNAGGFPHAFLGTRAPVDLWLVRVHARLLAGRLSQSEFSPITTGETRRLASGAAVVLTPRGVPGLELGATSFAHLRWPEDGIGAGDVLEALRLELAGGRKDRENESTTNHLISGFFRWTVPEGGVEVYGEMMREDWSPHARHIAQEPDDLSGYTLGLQKVWSRGVAGLTAFRAEVTNAQTPHRERGDRGITPHQIYIHSEVRQGHTHRGQLLVSPASFGGSGVTLGVDRYDPRGRWTVELQRTLTMDWPTQEKVGDSAVLYALGLEALRFWKDLALFVRVEPAVELNRHLRQGHDVFNLSVVVGASYR